MYVLFDYSFILANVRVDKDFMANNRESRGVKVKLPIISYIYNF